MAKWTRVKLKGGSQHIPRICPNCLKPTEMEWRYCYVVPMPLYFLHRTRYWQTFYYCGDCSKQLDAFFKKENLLGWLFFIWLVGGVATLIGSITQSEREGALVPLAGVIGQDAVVIGSLVLYAALVTGLTFFIKSRYKKRAPLQPSQAVWGPAAYYVGDGALGFGGGSCVYKAARPEWLKALVEANPDQADDKTYQRVVGRPKQP